MPKIEIIPNWHPLVVHFAIALLLTAAALFVLGAALARRSVGPTVTLVARWNLGLGVASAAFALGTGWQAYSTVAHDEPSHANMTVHMWWALGTALVFLGAAGAAWFDRRRPAGAGGLLLVLLAVGASGLAVTGWLGGENVYRYGLGVQHLPKSDDHAHPSAGMGEDMNRGQEAAGSHEHGSGAPDAARPAGRAAPGHAGG